MFSIAAINDTESKGQWEPLAPTKEAQEFRLSQTYHEGLLKLQAKEYDKARASLESVLKDPLVANAQVDSGASDNHLLQLRFLALKNLAAVFLQLGSSHYENALQCYLQAVEIDSKDSVVWNKLGTLACSMGLLSCSRWAFEQGLVCSPNNWNCMEKLLEVLIAIGDEVACFSVAELILRHWPSHSRALYVKQTIEESEPIPFTPRGVDKLEPTHILLKFPGKRKACHEILDVGVASKKLKQHTELQLAEASWVALTEALINILLPLSGHGSEMVTNCHFRSGDIRIILQLPSASEIVKQTVEMKGSTLNLDDETMPLSDCTTQEAGSGRDKETMSSEDQRQERRSTRLERLRSRKPGKEELDFTNGIDPAKGVLQYLGSFITGIQENKDSDQGSSFSGLCAGQATSLNTEFNELNDFMKETSENFGAYHMAHLLLEHVASKSFTSQDAHAKFLDLEKLTRNWGQDRTPECSLFLAELYHDLGSSPSNFSMQSEYMLEASYHLCKIIEAVAQDYPLPFADVSPKENCTSLMSCQGGNDTPAANFISKDSYLSSPLYSSKRAFWARFFWLSGKLSILEGRKEKAYRDFCITQSLLGKEDNTSDSLSSILLTHCKMIKELLVENVLYEINLLKLDVLLEKTIGELIEREMYEDCIELLAPLLFSTKDIFPLPAADKICGVTSLELSALDVLIKACEKRNPMEVDVYFKCRRRKLQILMLLSGMDECLVSCKAFNQNSESKPLSASDVSSRKNISEHWNHLIADEVKAISTSASQLKNLTNQTVYSNGFLFPVNIVGEIQSLLLAVMLSIARNFLFTKSSEPEPIDDQTEQTEKFCFLNAAIAFCKLQHLDPTVSVKNQVDLIVGFHDWLAEYGICCVGENGEGEEATFLKFAIKHLLALDIKIKSTISSSTEETSQNESISDVLDAEMVGNDMDEIMTEKRNESELMTFKSSASVLEKANARDKCNRDVKIDKRENISAPMAECANELTEEEKEELELIIDNALDQCFFCLYGLKIRCDSSYEDDLVVHKNSSHGDYQSKEQCADVFQYILPYAKASSRTGLIKLRRVLRALRKHFPQPPDHILADHVIDKYLDDPNLCEDKLSEEAGSDGYCESIKKMIFPGGESLKQYKSSLFKNSETYADVYQNLYYFLTQSEEISATDKWPGFVLTKEGAEFVQQNANLFKFDLIYNPLRFESWQKLANLYDEEVDLLLNDGSKHINVTGWRSNTSLAQRVEISRRRSRRCLLMSLALAKTQDQQCEIHELLALVYYDGVQNVVPFYDQRSVVPSKDATWRMYCENSLKHFKKAFLHRQDWSHAFYMGKLCEKLGYSHEMSLAYYDKAIVLNPSAVDPVYRMHASRLKLLCRCGKQNLETLKVISSHCYKQSVKDIVLSSIYKADIRALDISETVNDDTTNMVKKSEESVQMDEVWNMLYNDCLSALEICVEGDLKHFHKARYMLAHALYQRGKSSDLHRAKDELAFCFKSSRSSFTINMWEIDGMVKKGRRKAPGVTGNKKILEVNLPESSRKFITCIRKYLLFYLKLLEETGDINTLDRASISLRSDKRFLLCIEDMVPLALGRYIKVLISSMSQGENMDAFPCENQLEKIFSLFMEQGNLWPEICHLPEIISPGTTESSLYGYLHMHIVSLERNGELVKLEAINERMRKRFKNPKLSNSNCAKVCRHASVAWCRTLIVSMASITPLHCVLPDETQSRSGGLENSQFLCVDVQSKELWNSLSEGSIQSESLETKWSPVLTKIKNTIIKKVSDDNLETANSLLRSAYSFYRETSCVMLQSGVNLFLVPSRLAVEAQVHPGMEEVEVLDVSIPRKLLLWAYTLLHGQYTNISLVVKHMEENAKPKMKKGVPNSPKVPAIHTGISSAQEGASDGGRSEPDGPQEGGISTPTTNQPSLSREPQTHSLNSPTAEKNSRANPEQC